MITHLSDPPRRLSPAQEAYCRTRGSDSKLLAIVLLGVALFLLGTIGILSHSGSIFADPLGYTAMGFMGLIAAGLFFGSWRYFASHRGKANLVRFLLEQGNVVNAQVASNKVRFQTQLNNVPQRVIEVHLPTEKLILKTFDHSLADHFPEGQDIMVLVHPRCPSVVLPVSRIPD